jgi:hypothetical protein
VISPLPLRSKPGTWLAMVSEKRSAPSSTSFHTAAAVTTLVLE